MAIFLATPFRYCLMPDVCRYPLGESCLSEEAPPVVSTAPSPGRLLLLTDRHASCPGALGCLPQRVHKEEFHSVTLGSSHFITQCASARCSRYCTKAKASQVRWRKRLLTCLLLYHRLDLSLAVDK